MRTPQQAPDHAQGRTRRAEQLKAPKVLTVGTGGPGARSHFTLAAAGVGTIGIVDFDVVDESNLQRQIIHGTSDVGRPKLESAHDKIKDINPNVEVRSTRGAHQRERAGDLRGLRRDRRRHG